MDAPNSTRLEVEGANNNGFLENAVAYSSATTDFARAVTTKGNDIVTSIKPRAAS
jgi:hypothetical protein